METEIIDPTEMEMMVIFKTEITQKRK